MSIKKLLYTSLVDISIPYGPGINERTFIKDMARRFGENFKAVIPKPSRGVPSDLQDVNNSFLNYARSSRHPLGWVEVRITGSFRLLKIVKSFNPELIVMRHSALPFPQYLICQKTSIPIVIKHAGPGNFKKFYKASSFRRITSGLNEFMYHQLLYRSSLIDVVNDGEHSLLSSKYPDIADRIHTIDNGVDLDMFNVNSRISMRKKLDICDDDILIGYVGSYPMKRGGKEVIDIIKNLNGSISVKGIIVGDSGEANQAREYAKRNGVADKVIITGQVEYEKVPDIMAAMDVGLSILRPIEQHCSEQKVRQYLASGLCVIGTPGSNDFLKEYDFARIVSGDSIPELTYALLSLVNKNNSDVLCNRQDAARQFAKSTLSVSSRNTYKLKLWEAAIAKKSLVR